MTIAQNSSGLHVHNIIVQENVAGARKITPLHLVVTHGCSVATRSRVRADRRHLYLCETLQSADAAPAAASVFSVYTSPAVMVNGGGGEFRADSPDGGGRE